MINYIEKENEETQKAIYLAPVYMTLYAANADGVLSDRERSAAIEFAQVETYHGPEFLQDYFITIQKDFAEKLDQLNRQLPYGKEERDAALIALMAPVREFAKKLDEEEIVIFKRELLEFTSLVEKSNRSVLEAALFPLFSGFLHDKNHFDADDMI